MFDVLKLSIEEFSASLGLPMTPKVRFLNQKIKGKKAFGKSALLVSEDSEKEDAAEIPGEKLDIGNFREESVARLKENLEIGDSEEENGEKGFLQTKNALNGSEAKTGEIEDLV